MYIKKTKHIHILLLRCILYNSKGLTVKKWWWRWEKINFAQAIGKQNSFEPTPPPPPQPHPHHFSNLSVLCFVIYKCFRVWCNIIGTLANYTHKSFIKLIPFVHTRSHNFLNAILHLINNELLLYHYYPRLMESGANYSDGPSLFLKNWARNWKKKKRKNEASRNLGWSAEK